MQLTEHLKSLYIKTAKKLKGSDRRQFMAEVVKGLGIGGQTLVERELGWNRRTIRKGMQELESGKPFIDGFERSGRKRVETKLPNLLEDIKSLVDPQSQTDPSFKSIRLYTRMTASEVRRQLIEQFGYTEEELPSSETIRRKLNDLGYTWLEQHWNGSLLDTVETVLNFAHTLTFKGKNPVVTLVETVYCTGVKLTTSAMAEIETQIHRLPNLKKWFVEIFAKPA
ncbi:MAG: ISAzo13-like element transposase-related protein [Nostoc sp.]